MNINRENCEAWFLDYYEGNLSKEGMEEVLAFLNENPDMAELFDSYEPVSFAPDKGVSFEEKDILKRDETVTGKINDSNYEEYFVLHAEGMLDADGKELVEKFLLEFPSRRQELELLKLAVLSPDEEIVFEHKDALKRSLTVTSENFDEMAISSVEGLLNREEESAFSVAIADNADQQRAYLLYRQTKVSPDASVVLEDKESLKKKDRGAFWWLTDTKFVAAAAVVLLAGILYWNFSGNAFHPDATTGLAANDSVQLKNNNTVKQTGPVKDPLADVKQNPDSAVPVVDSHPTKHLANNVYNSFDVHDDKATPAPEKITTSSAKIILASNLNPQVDFSGAYYSYAEYTNPAPAVSSSKSISPRQAAMRWMKKKLDRTPVKGSDEEPVYTASTDSNKDVNGFDLTSSAVSALGNATGANLHLDHEQEGTILTVGKYEVVLNHNN